jgi:hypothetical protein
MATLTTVGVALWPGLPKPNVTAMTLCRQSRSIAAGAADGSIWLWRAPAEWHPFPKVGRRQGPGADMGEDSLRPLAVLCGQHKAAITSLMTICEGKQHVLFSADSSGCMCVWRLEDGVCLKTSKILAWAPCAMVNVSCKGKSLIACCGPSPDIEVIDIGPMRRIVRLFGHGDWCTDLCVRPREALMELDAQSGREPSIYSLDQGGTVCVWLAERTCSPTMVGWVPSVQCHRVAVSCPTSLVLDKHGAALLVMGREAAAHYRLGRDHRFADKSAPPLVFSFASASAEKASATPQPPEDAPSASARGGAAESETGAATATAPETAAQRRAKRLAVAANGGVGPGVLACCKLIATGFKVQGVLSPGGDRAVVWRPNDALLLLRTKPDGRTEVERLSCHAVLNIVAVCADSTGWLAFASRSGDLCVWSAESVRDSLPLPACADSPLPAPHLSAVSALRSRHASNDHPSDDARPPVTTAPAAPEDGHVAPLLDSNKGGGGGEGGEGGSAPLLGGNQGESPFSKDSTVAEITAVAGDVGGAGVAAAFAALARDWKFQGAGWLAKGFYAYEEDFDRQLAGGGGADWESWLVPGKRESGRERARERDDSGGDSPGVAARPHASGGKEVETETQTFPAISGEGQHCNMRGATATVSLIHVEGLVHGASVRRGTGATGKGAGRRAGRCRMESGVYWVVGDTRGCVSIMSLPSGGCLVRLEVCVCVCVCVALCVCLCLYTHKHTQTHTGPCGRGALAALGGGRESVGLGRRRR